MKNRKDDLSASSGELATSEFLIQINSLIYSTPMQFQIDHFYKKIQSDENLNPHFFRLIKKYAYFIRFFQDLDLDILNLTKTDSEKITDQILEDACINCIGLLANAYHKKYNSLIPHEFFDSLIDLMKKVVESAGSKNPKENYKIALLTTQMSKYYTRFHFTHLDNELYKYAFLLKEKNHKLNQKIDHEISEFQTLFLTETQTHTANYLELPHHLSTKQVQLGLVSLSVLTTIFFMLLSSSFFSILEKSLLPEKVNYEVFLRLTNKDILLPVFLISLLLLEIGTITACEFEKRFALDNSNLDKFKDSNSSLKKSIRVELENLLSPPSPPNNSEEINIRKKKRKNTNNPSPTAAEFEIDSKTTSPKNKIGKVLKEEPAKKKDQIRNQNKKRDDDKPTLNLSPEEKDLGFIVTGNITNQNSSFFCLFGAHRSSIEELIFANDSQIKETHHFEDGLKSPQGAHNGFKMRKNGIDICFKKGKMRMLFAPADATTINGKKIVTYQPQSEPYTKKRNTQ